MTRLAARSFALSALLLSVPAFAAPKWDSNGDGRMERAEFIAMASARMVRRLDKDGDGAISLQEWKARPAAAKATGDPERRFAKLDKNGDGKLDASELVPTMEKRFTRMDTDKDGILTAAERKAAHRPQD